MIEIPTVDQLHLEGGARVFYRVDYNVPLDEGRVADATRIEETLPTLHMLRERGAAVVIGSHLGRPKGTRTEKDSLKPIQAVLQELTGHPVQWSDDCIGAEAERLASALKPGEILLLENLRYHAGEEKNDPEFAQRLRKLGHFYVNDAFGACHRAHASIVALPELFDPAHRSGGLLLAKELNFLQKVTNVSDRPFVALLGGAKIAGKIEPLEALIKLADRLLIGGGMANTFLASRGVAMGSSLVDQDSLEVARRILGFQEGGEILLPSDLIICDDLGNPQRIETVDVASGVPDGMRAVDIGPKTVERYASVLIAAKTIFWNGPMGVFERQEFATGTMAMARSVAEAEAITVVGGGESVEAVKASGFADRISHISTGGGASLEFIAGALLPGVEVLREGADGH
jgi:phosphoglycerate kinase